MKGKNTRLIKSQQTHARLFRKYQKKGGSYNSRKTIYHWECYNRQNVSNELLTKGEKRAIWAYHKYDFDKKNYCKIPWVKNVP